MKYYYAVHQYLKENKVIISASKVSCNRMSIDGIIELLKRQREADNLVILNLVKINKRQYNEVVK